MGKLTLLALCLGVSLSALASPDLTLGELQAKLANTRGSHWTAGKTSVSDLTFEQKKHLTGAILPEGFGDYFSVPKSKHRNRSLPFSIDWRNVDGVSYASPILNQGFCGSCVAFAAIGTLETQLNISRKTPFSPWQLSPQHIFACGGGGCETGWTPNAAAEFLKTDGVPDEACFPYTSGAAGADLACTSSCSDSASRSLKIAGYSMPSFFFVDMDKIKQALTKGPLMTTLTVYEDFFYYKSGVYKHTTGKVAGGHAVSIVGFDDKDQAWIVRNSWGPDYGENGYVKIAYDDDSGIGNMTFSLDVGDSNGFVAIENLRDHALLHGQVPLTFNSTYPGVQDVQWVVKSGGKDVLHGTAIGMKAVLDTTKLADGVYELTAIAGHRDGLGKSEPRVIYVLNGTYTGKVEFKSVKTGDKIGGDVHLEFAIDSAPIPFTKITFRAKNVTTGEVVKKTTTNVANKMILNWRTKNVPNGDYDLTIDANMGDADPGQVHALAVRVTLAN